MNLLDNLSLIRKKDLVSKSKDVSSEADKQINIIIENINKGELNRKTCLTVIKRLESMYPIILKYHISEDKIQIDGYELITNV